MKAKPVVPRGRAERDVGEAVEHYAREGGGEVALEFIQSLQKAYTHIGRHPGSGSLRYAHELGLPELRCWALARFPHLIFYVERSDHVDIWRVLHARRDVPASMQDPSAEGS